MRTYKIENKEEIEQIVKACKTCFVAMSENNFPYVLPMNFAFCGDSVILHSAQKGRMWEILKKNPKVCINWTLGEELAWQNIDVGCSYRVKSKSVLVEGTVEFINDYDEKYNYLLKMMAQYSSRDFKFNKPAVTNVGIIKVNIETVSAREFGAKVTPH
ncbi:MAG: pyridoxamine 5'-phosphate oxidase family protein [Bacteroidales bacterium]|jgi:nitroimidazol reductase NimA-like FMN-containing flavoprotein (pyridoxamine 5'-phosphate oxidase superfamily)|nr:pyridoxamine 5'-phosphate oxidase family protein [Bacteroidales bacterium]